MLLIARRTALAAALLLVMPLTVWLSGWLWQPGLPVAMLKSLWWVTETVTQPWGIITHVVLCGWFLWCLRFRLRAALILFLILAAAILAGQTEHSAARSDQNRTALQRKGQSSRRHRLSGVCLSWDRLARQCRGSHRPSCPCGK